MELVTYSCRILIRLNFLARFSKNNKIPIFAKVRPVGAELVYADGQTDMTKLIVAFRNSASARKIAFSVAVCMSENMTLHPSWYKE